MSKDNKVVNFPGSSTEEEQEPTPEDLVDEELVTTIQSLLEAAEEGDVQGVVLLCYTDSGMYEVVKTPSYAYAEFALRLELLRDQVKAMFAAMTEEISIDDM